MIFFFLSNSLVQLPTVRQLEGLQNDFTDSISIQREGEAQSKGDDQTSHQNQRIQSRVRIEHVGGRVSAEGEVAREGVNHVEREDDHIGTKDDVAHTLAGRLLQIRENGDKLDLRAVTEAEDGEHSEQGLLVENESLKLEISNHNHNLLLLLLLSITYSRLDRARLTTLAEERAISITSVVTQGGIGLNHTLSHRTTEVSNLSQTAGVGIRSTVEHHQSDVKNTGDGDNGSVTQSGELAEQRGRENDENGGNDQKPLTIYQLIFESRTEAERTSEELHGRRNLLTLRQERHTQVQLVGNDNSVTTASTETVQELDEIDEHAKTLTPDLLSDSRIRGLLGLLGLSSTLTVLHKRLHIGILELVLHNGEGSLHHHVSISSKD